MINGIYKLLKDPECSKTIREAMWSAVVVCLYFSFMIYGLAVLSYLSGDGSPGIQELKELGCKISQLEKVTYSVFYPGESQCKNYTN